MAHVGEHPRGHVRVFGGRPGASDLGFLISFSQATSSTALNAREKTVINPEDRSEHGCNVGHAGRKLSSDRREEKQADGGHEDKPRARRRGEKREFHQERGAACAVKDGNLPTDGCGLGSFFFFKLGRKKKYSF